jgi:N-formylglutamate amidohydrolase
LLISVQHDGRDIPVDIRERMTDVALSIPDTDWHVARLYEFALELDASMVVAKYSRYVLDLNRSANDAALYEGQVSTGLCPASTFTGENIYKDGAGISTAEKDRRVEAYWKPYHDQLGQRLQQLKDRFGYALLWDAHSIPSQVPALFPGELPTLNIGTNNGDSCPARIREAVAAAARDSDYSVAVDGRFRGGHITRHYGDPSNGRYAIQLELSQRSYMDEDSRIYHHGRAVELISTLKHMLQAFLATSKT